MRNDLSPRSLYDFSVKPRVLYVADVPNWSFDIKGRQYRRFLPQYEIDIGYAVKKLPFEYEGLYWRDLLEKNHYDVIWHLHSQNMAGSEDLYRFVVEMNAKGTQVILTQNNVEPLEAIKHDLKRYAAFNAISVNNPWAYKIFKEAGFQNIYKTYDGVDLDVFGHDMPILYRDFKIFFSSSKMRLDHKGYPIWLKVKEMLSVDPEIQFEEVITDSFSNKRTPEEMNKIYNECQVFVCLSISEGGPCTLLEAAACGLVPVMTKVGYSNYFKNSFIIERTAQACVDKILYLKDNTDVLINMSRGISKEILPWHDKLMSQHWGYFLQQAILKKKGFHLI